MENDNEINLVLNNNNKDLGLSICTNLFSLPYNILSIWLILHVLGHSDDPTCGCGFLGAFLIVLFIPALISMLLSVVIIYQYKKISNPTIVRKFSNSLNKICVIMHLLTFFYVIFEILINIFN